MCVCVSECRCNAAVETCVNNLRRLDMTDFDTALHLLNSSQSDALGTPKVSLTPFISQCLQCFDMEEHQASEKLSDEVLASLSIGSKVQMICM